MRKSVSLLSLFAVAVLLSACQSTSIQSAWFDPNFKGGPMQKIDVVMVGTNLASRRAAEDIFAQKLRDVGVDGVAGWTVIPDEARAAQQPFTEAVTRTGAQGLLVVRLLGVDTRTQVTTTMVPAMGSPFGGPFGGPSMSPWGPVWYAVPQVQQFQLANVEATLFEAVSHRPVWSATTQTFNPTSVAQETPGFARLVIGQLQARGLIAPSK